MSPAARPQRDPRHAQHGGPPATPPPRRWFADTLFLRLFLLMWAALVLSHLAAYLTVTGLGDGPPGLPRLQALPTLPSLPPGALGDGPPHGRPGEGRRAPPFERPGGPPDPGAPDAGAPGQPPRPEARPAGPPPGDGAAFGERRGPGVSFRVLDYGIRLLLIGLAAWWGARWLSAPMRRLVDASHALGASLGQPGEAPPQLDTTRGTREVRETAEVFNAMARRLDGAFRQRGLLTAAISHDLRTPLTRMRMRLEPLTDDAAVQRCFGDIAEMDRLIGSALELFRSSAAAEPMQPTDVAALVEALVDDLAEQGHPVTCRASAAIAPARPLALRRVVSNLLENALRYGERATAAVRHDGDEIVVTIDDEGPGIAPAQLESVFEPFHRLDPARGGGGAGLGLYIARDLAERQGGRVTLANRAGGGLRAQLRLPAAGGSDRG